MPEVVEDLGDERYVIFEIDAPRVDTEATRAAVDARTADDALLLPEERARFTVRLPTEVAVAVGEPLALSRQPVPALLLRPRHRRDLGLTSLRHADPGVH